MPVSGKPFKTMLPVGVTQSGCATTPAIGVDGTGGGVLITISEVTPEIQPDELVTVYV